MQNKKFVTKNEKLAQNWKKNPVVVQKYKGKFTRQEIRNYVRDRSEALEGHFDGEISIAIHDKELGWISGQWFNPGSAPIVPSWFDSYDENDDNEDDNEIDAFQIYYLKHATKKGGSSDHNDCLDDCLRNVIGLAYPWTKPETLKKMLKLKRDDPVDIKYIPELEKKLKQYGINVSGDHIYKSPKKTNQQIYLKLLYGHYSIDVIKTPRSFQISLDERKPLIWKKDANNSDMIIAYDGEYKNFTKDEWLLLYKYPRTSKHVPIPYDPKSMGAMPRQYDAFIIKADILKKESNGIINLYKTGTDSISSRALFNYCQSSIKPTQIEQIESIWIEKASSGPIIYGEKYQGPVYKYDIVSAYPNIMGNYKVKMSFPIKEGIYKTLTTEDLYSKCVNYGIYRCIVEKTTDKNKQKMFRYNKFNYYTHYDVKRAQKMNLKVEMVMDGQVNHLFYDASSRECHYRIFGEYVKLLFGLKQKGIDGAKDLLNTLWGSLCQKNILRIDTKQSSNNNPEIFEDSTIDRIIPINVDGSKHEILYTKNNTVYDTNWARIAPFMLARGRHQIIDIIENDIENVVRIHSDGWLTKTKLPGPFGKGLGDVKYEGYCSDVNVVHCNKVIGEFIM